MRDEKLRMPSKINPEFEKYSRISNPQEVKFLCKCLLGEPITIEALETMASSEFGLKKNEVRTTLLLFEDMGLAIQENGNVASTSLLRGNYHDDFDIFNEWFIDRFITYLMNVEVIDIDLISYEVHSDSYVMSSSSIKRKYAGFRNMLVDFDVIALRSDSKYTILQKLDAYISKHDVGKHITEKQLLAKLERERQLGNDGEEWVLQFERKRITNPDLQHKIKRISLIDVGAGFDIVSFNSDNSTEHDRFIEVKTYKGNEHFYWSKNEIEKASIMGSSYYLYLVDGDCLTLVDYIPTIVNNPAISILQSEDWLKKPTSFSIERVNGVMEISNKIKMPVFEDISTLPMAAEMSNVFSTKRNSVEHPFYVQVVTKDESVQTEKSTKQLNASPEYNNALKKSNRIFVSKIENKEINLAKLCLLLQEVFIRNIHNQYEWIAPYIYFNKKGLLLPNTSVSAFAEQMSDDKWFGSLTGKKKCKEDSINDYSGIIGMDEKDWDSCLDRKNTKARGKGIGNIRMRYVALIEGFDMEAIYD